MLISFLFPKDEAALTNTTEENVIVISDTEDFPVAQNINDFCNVVEQRTFEFSIHARRPQLMRGPASPIDRFISQGKAKYSLHGVNN